MEILENVLSIEKMKHLEELGVNTDNASMTWMLYPYEEGKQPQLSLREWRTFKEPFRKEHCIPAFTLQDILDKLPCFIGNQVLTIQKLADSYTCLYMEYYTRSMINITESKELIDAAYKMLCWCIENGYIKVGKEE